MVVVRIKKHLGQHFLHDRSAVKRILDALEAEPGERFLEIGPGPGTLTLPLLERGHALTAIEFDAEMVAHLQRRVGQLPLTLVEADAMAVDLSKTLNAPTKVFSNLPYNISVPLTARLLTRAGHIPLMVLMYQKEVAERIRAGPGGKAYGPISVLVGCFYHIDWTLNVKPGSFVPPPKVMSQVIRLRRRLEPLIELEELPQMTALVRFLFNHRRKTVATLLKKWSGGWTDGPTLLESLKSCEIDPRIRPEGISVADYVRWYRFSKGAS